MFVGVRPDPAAAVAPAALCNDYDTTFVAGQTAARWLQGAKPGESARLVLFEIMTLGFCRDGRMQGFVDGVTEVMGVENVEIMFRDTVEHRREVALAQMEDQLIRDPDFNIFTACGADGALGAIAALRAAGRAQAEDKAPLTEYIFTPNTSSRQIHLHAEYIFTPNTSSRLTAPPRNSSCCSTRRARSWRS